MKTGDKITTDPIIYEIEILSISKEVPKEHKDDFNDWLIDQARQCGVGRNCEYYSYSENYKDDIEVLFYLK